MMTTHELAALLPSLSDARSDSGLRSTAIVQRRPGLSPCWEWTAAHDDKGYGQIWLDGSARRIHRLVALRLGMDAPQTRHRCDNPPCFNPDHLLGGTNADNQTDAVMRGRHKNSKKDTCPLGHPYTDHISTDKAGKHRRRCRTCEDLRRVRGRKKKLFDLDS